MLYLFFLIQFHFPAFGQGLTFERAIEEAKDNSPELMKASQELKAAKANFWEGISPENPKLFAEFEGIYRSRHPLSEYRERKFGFVQELEFPLAYVYKGRWHRSEKNRKLIEYLSFENGIISAVKKKFFQVLLLENQLQLYQEITNLTEELYRKAKIRVEAGESSSYDAVKAKVDLAEVENRALAIVKVTEELKNDGLRI
ncbi:MAG: TolC family protein [bacterium]|nr:MAG: TolC family protein [bacterium]